MAYLNCLFGVTACLGWTVACVWNHTPSLLIHVSHCVWVCAYPHACICLCICTKNLSCAHITQHPRYCPIVSLKHEAFSIILLLIISLPFSVVICTCFMPLSLPDTPLTIPQVVGWMYVLETQPSPQTLLFRWLARKKALNRLRLTVYHIIPFPKIQESF